MRLEKLFHACLTLLFLVVVCAIFVSTAKADEPAEVQLTLSWDAPLTGGPLTEYVIECTGDIPVSVTTSATSHAAPPASFAGGVIGGACSGFARGPGGDGPVSQLTWSYAIDITPPPPGQMESFRLTLDCTIAEGTVTCEQV